LTSGCASVSELFGLPGGNSREDGGLFRGCGGVVGAGVRSPGLDVDWRNLHCSLPAVARVLRASAALPAALLAPVRGLGMQALALTGALGLGLELEHSTGGCLFGLHGVVAALR
jgi:hypothetical protein